jgi:hypothetical protein
MHYLFFKTHHLKDQENHQKGKQKSIGVRNRRSPIFEGVRGGTGRRGGEGRAGVLSLR